MAPGAIGLPARVERIFNGKIPPRELHPFSPLTEDEIKRAAGFLKAHQSSEVELRFKAITLHEPEKALMKKWFQSDAKPTIDRKAYSVYYFQRTDKVFEAVVNLSTQKVESNKQLEGFHACADGDELLTVERVALEDKAVQAEIAKLQLPEGTVVVSDPWIYGSDGVDDTNRLFQCYLYTRPKNELNSNHYASPITISPVIDPLTMKVVRIDHLPLGIDHKLEEPKPFKPTVNEYLPEHQDLRTDLKPLNIVQPEGVSFKLAENGELVEWQKWKFRVGFNYREGMVLYNVKYDGRDLFYRVSLSDMAIPYADPRRPYHRKQAFDLGDVGAGVMANNLKLGCDCLGTIAYLSFPISNDKGEPMVMENCVCVHEQDAGIQFKHTNYRSGHAVVARMRELVLQSIITVANYEYIFAFYFNTAGELSYEIRATGILSTAPIDPSVTTSPNFGTIVHPGVLAQHHQHIFSLRIDPAIDGFGNKIVYEEAKAMEPHPELNPFNIGYYTEETNIDAPGGFMEAPQNNRVWKIQNPKNINPINGKCVGYKVVAPPFQKIVAHADSFHYKRAEFADKAVYVTKYQDWELYSAGQFTNQSRGGTGVRNWVSRAEKFDVEQGDDVVMWVQFGINHIPRVEDFPIMPVETVRVHIKPVNFFDKNPALDLPPSTQDVNKSILASSNHHQGGMEAEIDKEGSIANVHASNGDGHHDDGGACC